METNLEQAVLEAVVRLWPTASGSLSSRVVYQHLRERGVAIPKGAMESVWKRLLQQRQVNGVLLSIPGSVEVDGGLTVNWVDPALLG